MRSPGRIVDMTQPLPARPNRDHDPTRQTLQRARRVINRAIASGHPSADLLTVAQLLIDVDNEQDTP